MTDKQIIIDDYFRKIVDINGEIVDYEIKNSDVSKMVQKIEKYNSYIEAKEQECEELKEKNKLLMIKATDGISKRDWAYEQRKKKYDQLKAENETLFKAIEEIGNIIGKYKLSENAIKLKRIDPIDVQEILNIVIRVRKNVSEVEGKD